jgi:hypothetical protein
MYYVCLCIELVCICMCLGYVYIYIHNYTYNDSYICVIGISLLPYCPSIVVTKRRLFFPSIWCESGHLCYYAYRYILLSHIFLLKIYFQYPSFKYVINAYSLGKFFPSLLTHIDTTFLQTLNN